MTFSKSKLEVIAPAERAGDHYSSFLQGLARAAV